MDTGEHKGEIRCHSGMFYNYEDPRAEMILLEDIAHQLSNTCRFSGACDPYYSVAEHSVLVSRLCTLSKPGLLHDAAEAYLWDIPRPAKHLYGEVYAELTEKCDRVIAERFSINAEDFHSPQVSWADAIALNFEGNTIMPGWDADKPVIPEGILDWKLGLPPNEAKKLFLHECSRQGVTAKIDYAPPLPLRERGENWLAPLVD